MALTRGGRRRRTSRRVRKAPKRYSTSRMQKMVKDVDDPFNAVLGSVGLKKPVDDIFRSVRVSMGGKKHKHRKKTHRKKRH
jgi:hypothetical protein